ncbi:MAG: aconitate hydratase [Spirochaetia bacterium]
MLITKEYIVNITEKVLSSHLVQGNMKSGEEIAIQIDQTLTQDATGTMVYLQFEAMEIPRVKTELSVSYVDHNTLQNDYRNMDDHRFLQSAAAKYGLYFSRPGNGICHQVHLERFGKPGKTLLGSDSHTPTGGGLGMIAIGAGGLDVAVAMAGGPFYLTMPEVIGVELTGVLQPMCSAKDVILTLLKLESVKGGVGKVYEYFGPGVQTLSVPERATITNMGAELGATTSIFPSDDVTKTFLETQKRGDDWKELTADAGSQYSKIIKIDLSKIVPMAACPHMPDEVVEVSEIAGKKVDQVVIGSCTNSSINDLGAAADLLADNVVAPETALGIAPGSRQVLENAIEAGIIPQLVKSGARILESACGPCIGMGFAPCSKGVTVRTFNRNFKGRSGTKDAEVFLVSPETAAAAAITGQFTDPRELRKSPKKDYSSFIQPDESMIIPPLQKEEAEKTEIIRGPNIQPCPKAAPVAQKLNAEVLLKTGDNITTDHIMPAGAKILPLRSNIPAISQHVFEAVDPDFAKKAEQVDAGVIIGGENYGQGSSREHAALAPMYLGVKAVITKSFARIHKANLINFGIIPLTFTSEADYGAAAEGMKVQFPDLRTEIQQGNQVTAVFGDKTVKLDCTLGEREKSVLLAGGKLNYTKEAVS